jgi:hypothetical protein
LNAVDLQHTPRFLRELDAVPSGGAGRGRVPPVRCRHWGRRGARFSSSTNRYESWVGFCLGLGFVGGLLLSCLLGCGRGLWWPAGKPGKLPLLFSFLFFLIFYFVLFSIFCLEINLNSVLLAGFLLYLFH